jgi:hypothetical protein
VGFAHAVLDCFTIPLDEFPELLGRRQRDQIARDEELIVEIRGGKLDFGLVSIAAENDADWWVIIHGHDLPLEIIEVEIHLPCVAMAERADFQVE